jgi:hypothetical protein
VPDGIVNNKTFTKLRQLLLENGLYAVVSLHQYVFKPYAGAKTSILLFDKSLAKNKGNILFAEIENDGYQKSVQRKKIEANDLPALLKLIKEYKKADEPESVDTNKYGVRARIVNLDKLDKNIYFHYLDQATLFPNTYIDQNSVAVDVNNSVKIGDVFQIRKGTLQSTKATPGPFKFITASDEYLTHDDYKYETEALVVAVAAGGSLGKIHYVNDKFIASDLCFILTPKKRMRTNLLFYLYYFKDIRLTLVRSLAKGVGKLSINKTDFSCLLIDDFDEKQQEKVGKKIKELRVKISEQEKAIEALDSELVMTVNSARKKVS